MSGDLLLVDDDPAILDGLGLILTARGIPYRTAPDGERAIAAAQAARPSLILLDFNLPGMDGIQILDQLQAVGIAVPTVLMSANLSNLPERASQHGFVAALPKPFTMAEVYALVDRFTG